MRMKTFFIGMMLLCSFVALPAFAQVDPEPVEDAPEFTLTDDQAVSVNDGEVRDAASLRDEMTATNTVYIIIRGRFVAAHWYGNIIRIYCRVDPNRICAIIRLHSATSTTP